MFNDLQELTRSKIDEIVKINYNEILKEIKTYSRQIVLNVLGIKLDHWGHVSEIGNELTDLIINQNDILSLKQSIIKEVTNNIKIKLNEEGVEEKRLKYYNSKVINELIRKSILRINKEIENELEENLHELLTNTYKKQITDTIYSNPLIQELSIRKF